MSIDDRYEDIPEDILDNVDIEILNPRSNPYSKRLKKQGTINPSEDVVTDCKEGTCEPVSLRLRNEL